MIVLAGTAVWAWWEPLALWYLARQPGNGLTDYVRTHPESYRAAERLGDRLVSEGRTAEALSLLSGAVERFPADPALRVIFARALLADGNASRAYAELQAVIHVLHEETGEVDYWLGRSVEYSGRKDEAFAHYQEAVRRDPERLDALIRLGKIAESDTQFSQAERYFRQAVRVDPRSPEAVTALAETEFHLGKTAEAVRWARQAVSLVPADPTAQFWLGRALWANDPDRGGDEAEAALRRAVATSPQAYTPRFYLARLLRERGKLVEARQELERNVRENPLHDSSFQELALCARAMGDRARAREALERFRKLNEMSMQSAALEYKVWVSPENVDHRRRLARFYVEHGRPDLAKVEVDRILKSHPGDPEARRLQADINAHPRPSL